MIRPAAPARVVRAALVAGVLSGIPSTVHAAIASRDVLASVRAAGTLLGRPTIARGLVAHALVTTLWTAVIAAVPLARRTVAHGAAAGVVIGVADLAVAQRRFPAIAALPTFPQLFDHAAFGALVAATLGGDDLRPAGGAPPSP
jgi:hypothetical protein